MPSKQRAGAKRGRANYVADFETTTDEYVNGERATHVWSWGLAATDNPKHVEMSTDLDSFITRISEHNSTTWFHNLKFDGMFILYWLMTNDYEYFDSKFGADKGTFKTLIDGMGKFYSITVRWRNGHTTEFRDSWKKLPMSAKRVAVAFKLDEGKGTIDYRKDRPIGYEPTPAEWDYLRRDVSIIAQAMQEVLANGMTKLTVASDAMAEYKSFLNDKSFAAAFPILSPEMDSEIRRAYRGGYTYGPKRFQSKILGSGLVLDVNSLYPSVMMGAALPYGEPEWVDGKVEPSKTHPLTVFSITFTAKLRKDHIPVIQIKGNNMFGATEYLEQIEEPTTLMITNVDLALYQKHYHLTILAYGGGWRFRSAVGMFKQYIDKWSKIKEESTGGKREVAKLHLNSLYGKFASNPQITSKYPVMDDGVVKLKRAPDDVRDPVYTAMGVFITSYARSLIITAAQDNYDVFAYCDTDSLHLMCDTVPDGIDIHPTRMGAFKLEYTFQSAFYIRPKAYLEKLHTFPCKDLSHVGHGEACLYVTHIAGLPEDVTLPLTFADMTDNKVFSGKLTPKSVPGGIVLVDIPFRLKL